MDTSAPRYIDYDDPAPTLWQQIRADAAREAENLLRRTIELVSFCGTLAVLIVGWDWL